MSVLLELFLTFAKIGAFTFGGGYAMISIIENNCVEKKKWINHEDMMNITAIAESTPGPVAINCATFVGYKRKGISGAIAATLGVVLPSFLIICIISFFLDHFLEMTLIANAFKGIKLAVGILILDASLKMFKKMKKNVLSISILLCSIVGIILIDVFALHFSTICIMLIGGMVYLLVTFLKILAKG